mgnify:FL=1
MNSKCAAAIVLNGYWKILFFYWFLWRWFFYVMQYSDEELLPLIETGKKSTCGGILRLYNITDRDEGYRKVDDEGGSKSYPSREFYGSAWSAGEKHPFLTHPLNLFFGIWVVPMWGYYWVHTAAQIELGLIDCPIIVYERGKKRKGGKVDGPEFEKADALDVVNKADKWQKKYGNAPKERCKNQP